MDNLASKYKKYFMPIHWAMELIRQARRDGLIGSDRFVVDLYEVRKQQFKNGQIENKDGGQAERVFM
jgi:hypothetical protein